jgi:hypothetical protein
MSFQMGWHQEGKVAFIRYHDTLTMSDIDGVAVQGTFYLDQAADTVHFLVDFSQLGKVDFSLPQLLSNQSIKQVMRHPRLGWTLYFPKQNLFYNFMATAISQITNTRMRFFDSQEKALAFLDTVI